MEMQKEEENKAEGGVVGHSHATDIITIPRVCLVCKTLTVTNDVEWSRKCACVCFFRCIRAAAVAYDLCHKSVAMLPLMQRRPPSSSSSSAKWWALICFHSILPRAPAPPSRCEARVVGSTFTACAR